MADKLMVTRKAFLAPLALIAALAFWSVPGSAAAAAEAGPDQGLVVFSRKNSMKGKAMRFNIEQDGRHIGQLLAGTTLEVPLAPGTYGFSVRAPSLDGVDSITINVRAGYTYYVEGEILWGWPAGRPKFRNLSESPSVNAPAAASAAAQAGDSVPEGAMAGAVLGSAVVEPSAAAPANVVPSQPTANERGILALRNFVGDWNLDMWSLAEDGTKLEGSGIANGSAEGESGTRIMIDEFHAPAFPAATGGGQVLIAYQAQKGFYLVSTFRHSGEVLRFAGQYQPDSGKYVFYLFGTPGGEIASGVPRSSVRVEVYSEDTATWVAETYSSVGGKSIQVQSYRFTRRQDD